MCARRRVDRTGGTQDEETVKEIFEVLARAAPRPASKSSVDAVISKRGTLARNARTNQLDFVKSLLKAGEAPKEATLRWLCTALAVNTGATALQPNIKVLSSDRWRLNLAACLLALVKPIKPTVLSADCSGSSTTMSGLERPVCPV